jgi:NADPH:quinone reductase
VRLTAYGGQVSLGPVQTYTLDQLRAAHDDMEHNRTLGKQVVVL